MAFRVEIAPQAFEDLDGIADYLKEESSFAIAEKWFNGILDDIATLREMPARCSIAPESEVSAGRFGYFSMEGEIVRTESTTRSITKRRLPGRCEFFTCATGPGSRSAETTCKTS